METTRLGARTEESKPSIAAVWQSDLGGSPGRDRGMRPWDVSRRASELRVRLAARCSWHLLQQLLGALHFLRCRVACRYIHTR